MARDTLYRFGSQAHQLREQHREWLLARFERISEPVLLFAAFAMIPLIAGSFWWDLSSGEQAAFTTGGIVVWGVFLVDVVVKALLAPSAKTFLRKHWLEIAIVAVPFFRPLYLVRLFLFGSRAVLGLRRLAEADFVFVLTAGLVIICSTVMFSVDSNNPQFGSFGDALWWGAVTVTTVGYGDIVPSTVPGRIVAFFLMMGGITLFGAVAGNVVALLSKARRVSDGTQQPTDILIEEVRALRAQVERLEGRIDS